MFFLNHISPKTDAQIEGKLDCLQRPKDGPGMFRCLEAEALPPPGFWSITNIWAERHIPTGLPPSPCAHGPGVSPARKGRKPECGPPSAASGPRPPGAPVTYVVSENCMHRCHTHTEAGMRPSNLQVHQPPLGRGQGLFPQVHNQPFPVSATAFWKLSPPTSKIQELQWSKSLCLPAPTFLPRLSPKRMFFLSLASYLT